jgi:nitrogen fixation NifU-like protein
VAEAEIAGLDTYEGKGFHRHVSVDQYGRLAEQRVVVLDTGDRAAQLAIDLTDHTGRVVLITRGKEPSVSPAMRSALRLSDVKVLAEAQPLELLGEDELERVRVHDLNEDEEYELTADAFVALE